MPLGAIQNTSSNWKLYTSRNNNNNNNNNNSEKSKLDELNKSSTKLLALIPATLKKKEDSLHFAPTAVTHELIILSAFVR
jgi:hypothetical protein